MAKIRSIVITGASSGIGKEVAFEFAKLGYRLFLGARRVDRLEEIIPDLIESGAESAKAIHLDVTDQKSTENFSSQILEEISSPDILVNNAGMVIGVDYIDQGNPSDWQKIIDTNLMGVLRISRCFLPAMKKSQTGQLIMIGSIAGHQPYEGGGAYCASKHGLKAITASLKLELCGTNIRVNSIDPGMVNTEFSLVRFKGDQEKADSVYRGVTPLSPKDIAECVTFVATRPPHVNIDDIIIMPTDQAAVYKVHRSVD